MEISDSTWSEVAEGNSIPPPSGFSTGEAAGDVKLTFREMMAALKRNWNWSRPITSIALFTAPSSYRMDPTSDIPGYVDGMVYAGKPAADITGGKVISISGKSYLTLYFPIITGFYHAIGLTWAKAGLPALFCYDSSRGLVLISQPPYELVREEIQCMITSENGVVSAGTAKFTFRLPYAFQIDQVKATLQVPQASGNVLTIRINIDGAGFGFGSLTFVNGVATADSGVFTTNVNPADADAEVTIDITQIGDGTAAGLKITLLGYQT